MRTAGGSVRACWGDEGEETYGFAGDHEETEQGADEAGEGCDEGIQPGDEDNGKERNGDFGIEFLSDARRNRLQGIHTVY